jgi:hypothetical protein
MPGEKKCECFPGATAMSGFQSYRHEIGTQNHRNPWRGPQLYGRYSKIGPCSIFDSFHISVVIVADPIMCWNGHSKYEFPTIIVSSRAINEAEIVRPAEIFA